MHESENKPTIVSQPQTGAQRANSAGLPETNPLDGELSPIQARINEVRSQLGSQSKPIAPQPAEPPFEPIFPKFSEPPTQVNRPSASAEVVRLEPEPGVAAFVYFRRGIHQGQFIQLLKERNEFGSATDCDIVIEDKAVSAHHGALRYDGTTWRISDFDSINGTLVNDQKLGEGAANPLVLADNDKIAVGETELVFKCVEG